MALAAQAVLAVNEGFLGRVKVAIVAAAISIVNEAEDTPNHAARKQFAVAVAGNPIGRAQQMVWGVVADETINDTSADAVINTRVAAIWNAYSGS